MRLATTLTVGLVLTSFGIVPATADTVSLEASANAFGMLGSPDTNFPSSNPYGDIMNCNWNGGASNASKFWVKFDLSAIQGTATGATLKLTRTQASEGDDVILVGALQNGDADEGWSETTLTWNNAPGNVLNDYTLNWSTNMPYVGGIGYAPADGAGTVLSLTSDTLLAAINGDTNGSLTLAFTKRDYYPNEGAAFASRTNTTYAGPTLVLTGVTTVPEPSALILLYTALAGLLAYAWRKRK